jgi:hypothetical protein
MMKFMTSYHSLLDMRNLVTALHRLTKMDATFRHNALEELSTERGLQLILSEPHCKRRGRHPLLGRQAAPPAVLAPPLPAATPRRAATGPCTRSACRRRVGERAQDPLQPCAPWAPQPGRRLPVRGQPGVRADQAGADRQGGLAGG